MQVLELCSQNLSKNLEPCNPVMYTSKTLKLYWVLARCRTRKIK